MTDSERIKQQLYACAWAIYRELPPHLSMRMMTVSDVIEAAIPEPHYRGAWKGPEASEGHGRFGGVSRKQ